MGVGLLSLGLLVNGVAAQPNLDWGGAFGGVDDEIAYAVQQTDDGGYIVVGETRTFGAGGRDVWLLKLNAGGTSEWSRTFGGPEDDVAYDVRQTSDGGYIMAGETHSFRAGSAVKSDFWLVKTDASGSEVWNQRIGNTELPGVLDLPTLDEARSIQETGDGGYILAGWTMAGPSNDFWLVKTDGSGERLWDRQFGGSMHDQAYAVRLTADGGYVIAGKTDSVGAGSSDFWLVKTDSTGNEEWNKTFGGPLIDEARDVRQTADGGYILAGFTWSSGAGLADFWLVKTDASGNEEWSRTFGGTTRDVAHAVRQTRDGGYVLAGWSESFPDGDHFWVVKTDASGNEEWSETIGESSGARAVQQTDDGGYVIVGWTGSLAGSRNFRVVKTEPVPEPEHLSGAVAVLGNSGPSAITAATVVLNAPRGDTAYRFRYAGAFLSRENPLPPGETACTDPFSVRVPGAHLVSDQIGSYGAPLVDAIADSLGSPGIVVDLTAFPFDLAYDSATGGKIAGVLQFSSESPCGSASAGGPTPSPTPQPAADAFAPVSMDFFGTVVSVGEEFLLVNTDGGTVEVPVTDETSIRLPNKSDAGLMDLAEGDVVAVSLNEADAEPAADQIFLIPGKTRYRHVPGVVLAVSKSELTIQPPGAAAQPITLLFTSSTTVRFHKGETDLAEGSFVVVGTVGDPVIGGVPLEAREINVTAGKPGLESPIAPEAPAPEEAGRGQNSVEIRGEFEGLDAESNLTVNGTSVAVDAATVIAAGLVVGQRVNIEAVLKPGGSIVALKVEEEDEGGQVLGTVSLEGSFDGVDDEGNWLIGRVQVSISPGTDTDGLPAVGQQVKVRAVVQEDGTLLAREVENKSFFGSGGQDTGAVTLTGTFLGTDSEGNWTVNGMLVAVDALTRLEGSPAVGRPVAVEAIRQRGGSLRALRVNGDTGDSSQGEKKAKLRGTVENLLDDGTLIVDGILVVLSALTEIEDGARAGDFVEVEARLQPDGSLLAREVVNLGVAEAQDIPEPSTVEIEGTLESIDEEGNLLVVNGIKVALSVLSETKGELIVGSPVKLEGFLLPDGSVRARELKGEGRAATTSGTEVKIEGVIGRVNRNEAGDVESVVIDGLTLGVGALTEFEGTLEPGAEVSAKAIISNGTFLASKLERHPGLGLPETAEVQIEGLIEALQLDTESRVTAITINGVEVELGAFAKLEGTIGVGTAVKINGGFSEGVLVARKVEAGRSQAERPVPFKFDVVGRLEVVVLAPNFDVVAVVVNGLKITTEALTRVQVALKPGNVVSVEVVVSRGEFIASRIKAGRSDGTGEEADGDD
jgi:hypothetical protein